MTTAGTEQDTPTSLQVAFDLLILVLLFNDLQIQSTSLHLPNTNIMIPK